MKRITTILTFLMLLCMGGGATVTQPTLTTDTNNPVYYVIGSYDRGGYLTYNGTSATLTHEAESYYSLFYFVENGQGVSIIPAANPTVKLVSYNSATAAGAVWYLEENTYNPGYFCVSRTSDLSDNCLDASNASTSVGYWHPSANDYAGTSWTISTPSHSINELRAAENFPSLPADKYLKIGDKVNTFSVATSAADNSHWYVMTQTRDGESPIYDTGLGETLRRAASSVTVASLNSTLPANSKQYLVRFFHPDGLAEGVYHLQFATGQYLSSGLKLGSSSNKGSYAYYNVSDGSYTFAWNKDSQAGSKIDNNGAGNTVSFWGSGATNTSTATNNNVWTLYPVEFVDLKAAFKARYDISSSNLDKPGFPTSTAKETFEDAIDAITSGDFDSQAATALATYKASVVYPNGTYYIKNRNTGCYAFVTDDGELVPRIKIDNSTSHANNNYLWTVTSNKAAGTCDIVSSLYPDVKFAKGDNTYSNITSSNRTVITTLATELFSADYGTSGGFYLNGAHNNNVYNSAGNGNSHVASWNYTSSPGSQWIFEPVDLPEGRWTITVEGLEDGNHDSVILSDGTILNLGTGTVYLSETPTTSNITQNNVTGYSVLDGSIVIDSENKEITVTYSPSYETLVANYYDSSKEASVKRAGTLGYPKTTTTSYTNLMGLLSTFTPQHEYTASDYANIQTYYNAYVAESDLVLPSVGKFYRIKGKVSGKYVSGTPSSYQNFLSMTTATDRTTIYYIGEGTKLLSYDTGQFMKSTTLRANVGEAGDSYTITGKEMGYFNVKDGSSFLYDSGNTNGRLSVDRQGSDGGNNTKWSFEEVTELPITVNQVGDKYYATLYMPVPVSITGSTAYTLQLTTDNEWLTPTEVDGNVPAEQPVLLVGTSNEVTATVKSTAGDNVDTPLEGTLAAKVAAETDYFLGRYSESGEEEDYEVGFFKWTGTLKGFRAYLPATKVAASRGFAIKWNDDEVTGIRTIDNGQKTLKNGAFYDLSGRRVENPQHGLYIVNGKKVVIK